MQIQLFDVGQYGKSHNVTSQSRQNCYYQIEQIGERSQISVFGTPGYVLFVEFGGVIRGMYSKGDYLYVVSSGTFWEVNNAGTKVSRGTLTTTSGTVYFADNATQVMLVDGTNGYTYTPSSTTFAQITDGDFPVPSTVTWDSGYFIVNKVASSRFYISAINDGTTWAALDFASAEAEPDDLVRVIANNGELVLFGQATTEFWSNTGATDFPYARISGATNEWGLAAKASVARLDNSLAYLAANKMGEVIVARLDGYSPQRISNFALEHTINEYTTTSDAIGYSYMLGGHPMYVLNFPSAGYTWLYDGSTGLWSSLKSHGITRHRSNYYANFINKNYVSDYETGEVYRLGQEIYDDNGMTIHRKLVSKHVINDDKNLIVDEIQILMEPGVGVATGQGSNPQAMLRYSKDGGHTWSAELWTTIGAIGQYRSRIMWSRLGAARDWIFELQMSDPVKFVVVTANLTGRSGTS
mgnify:CR=1 FL=1